MNITIADLLKMTPEQRSAALQPNCFHMVYKVMEGDWRAGGWSSEKTMTLYSLEELAHYKSRSPSQFQIIRVHPAFELKHEFTEIVPEDEIQAVLQAKKEKEERQRKELEFARAKEQLKKAEKNLQN